MISNGRTVWIADGHHDDGKRFVVRDKSKSSRLFLELEGGKIVPDPSGQVVEQLEDIGENAHRGNIRARPRPLNNEGGTRITLRRKGDDIVAARGSSDWMIVRELSNSGARATAFERADVSQHCAARFVRFNRSANSESCLANELKNRDENGLSAKLRGTRLSTWTSAISNFDPV